VAKLEDLRRRAALSQEELGTRAGVSSRTIYNIERDRPAGEKPYAPRGKVMRAIAEVLGVAPADVAEFRPALGLPAEDAERPQMAAAA
jgi:DNA-binding XRE family transcriptional regulator